MDPTKDRLPPDAHGAWRIELRHYPIGHRSHAFLTLVDLPAVMFGESCMAWRSPATALFSPHTTISCGESGRMACVSPTRSIGRNFDYKADDISYETLGGRGGEIQNSNSDAYTYGKAMDLDLDGVVRDAGVERRLPGWGRNLLDPASRPYVAPPTFPPNNPP